MELDTSSTPTFLGLDAPGGFWDQLGGTGSAGENIIIGVVDSRHLAGEPQLLRPHRHQRQRDARTASSAYQQIPGLARQVHTGRAVHRDRICNQKLIGARYFNAGWGGNAGHRRGCAHGSSTRRATTTVTARTRRRPRAATRTCRRPGPARCSARSTASRRARASRRTRRCWSTQDAATASGFTARPRRGDRPGGRRRRRRHQLLDQRHADELPRSGRGGVPVRRRRRRVRRRLGRQQRPDDRHGRTPGPVAHDGRRGHAQSQRRGLGHARQRRDVSRRVVRDARSAPTPLDRLERRPVCPVRMPAAVSPVLRGGRQRRRRRSLDPAKVAGKIVLCDRGINARVNKSLAVAMPAASAWCSRNTAPARSTRRLPRRADRARDRTPSGARDQGLLRRTVRRDGVDRRRRRSCSTRRRRSRRRSRRAARCSRAAATC